MKIGPKDWPCDGEGRKIDSGWPKLKHNRRAGSVKTGAEAIERRKTRRVSGMMERGRSSWMADCWRDDDEK